MSFSDMIGKIMKEQQTAGLQQRQQQMSQLHQLQMMAQTMSGLGYLTSHQPLQPLPIYKTNKPIRAWREWRLLVRDGYLLQSLVRENVWEGPIIRADEKPCEHTTPGDRKQRGHGIYAYPVTHVLSPMQYSHASYPAPRAGQVEGEVELMGRVVRHEYGYRAEVARVVRLFLKQLDPAYNRTEVITQLAERYQCDVAWLPKYVPPKPEPEPVKQDVTFGVDYGYSFPAVTTYLNSLRGQNGNR